MLTKVLTVYIQIRNRRRALENEVNPAAGHFRRHGALPAVPGLCQGGHLGTRLEDMRHRHGAPGQRLKGRRSGLRHGVTRARAIELPGRIMERNTLTSIGRLLARAQQGTPC